MPSVRLQARRVAVLTLALALTLAILFGLQRWLFLTQTKLPLQTQLQKLPYVQRVTLQLSGASPAVIVTLGDVGDLESTYQTLLGRVRAMAPGAALRVQGHSDARLAAADETLNFPIEQALADGQFVAMRQDVLQEAAKLKVTARIYVDGQNVYLALYDRGHAAYFIYPRGGK